MNLSLDEIGEYWGRLFTQLLAQVIALEKQLDENQQEIVRLTTENEDLRIALRQAVDKLTVQEKIEKNQVPL